MFVAAVAVALGMHCVGCDTRSAPSAQSSDASTTRPDSRPTTQQLLTGPYKTLFLTGTPLSIRVPEIWKLDPAGALNFLEGPSPSGTSIIQFADRGLLKPDQYETLLVAAKKEQEQNPSMIKRAELRDVGKMKVLERVAFREPITRAKTVLDAKDGDIKEVPVLDASGKPETVTFTPVNWTVMIFVGQAGMFNKYELNVFDLTQEQYNADKQFLDAILRSVRYEAAPTAEPSSASDAPGTTAIPPATRPAL
jgi:hypothetical protein